MNAIRFAFLMVLAALAWSDTGNASTAYWINGRYIEQVSLDGTGYRTALDIGGVGAEDVAVDPIGGKLYWTDQHLGAIRQANLDGTGVETLQYVGSSLLMGIALDVPIPEPATLSLLAFGGLVLVRRRNRRRQR